MMKLPHYGFLFPIFLTFSGLLLVSCHNNKNQRFSFHSSPGPAATCPYGQEKFVVNKIDGKNRLNFTQCYDHSIKYLANHHLLLAKISWLKNTRNDQELEEFLDAALQKLGSLPQLHRELAELYSKQKKWQKALNQLNHAQTANDNPLRLQVLANLGELPQNMDLTHVPYIYRSIPLKHSVVKPNSGSEFSLKRISNGDSSKINGEPSITSSPDGENIWLLWTDSGQSVAVNGSELNFWTMQSSQSKDGGNTWTDVSMNTLPARVDRFHFDPMSIYDSFNNTIYAGGMVKGFGPNWGATADDAAFFYRWELDNDSNFGPFKTFIPQPDKGWMATDENGEITMAHHYGVHQSADKAETFNPTTTQNFISAQPRFLANGCLFITDISQINTCENNQVITFQHTFSSATFAQDDIPGTFRVFNFAQNAIHPNGDIYVVYHEYKSLNSSELSIQMTKSSDNGLTWSTPWVISADINRDQFAPWIEIDNFGGIHVVFFDSRNGTEADNSMDASLDVYYQYSNDLGQSWTETRVTSTSLQLPELLWGDYFFSDYISLALSDTSVYLAFPWSQQNNQMHMYFAKKALKGVDCIFSNGFDSTTMD